MDDLPQAAPRADGSLAEELRPPHEMPGYANFLMRRLIRAPLLHRLVSRNLMLISVTGRKSGRTYIVPLSYTREGDVVTACTSVTNTWPKNLKGGAEVRLLLRGSWVAAVAEPVIPAPEDLAWYLGRVPRDAKYHYVRLDKAGKPDPEDLKLAAREQLMVRSRIAV